MERAVGSYKLTTTTTAVYTQLHQWEGRLPKSYTNDARRLVGYYEYVRSLAMLEPLVNRASPAELKLIDELIAARPELTIYINLSRRIPKQRPSTLDAPAADEQDFARTGLAWMMALARVELGAIVVGFTDRPEPFATLPPTRFELPAYKELLLDGARMHYLALANDPAAQFYASYRNRPFTLTEREFGRPEVQESHAIAYSRRVALAKEFVQAVQTLGKGQLTPAQTAELADWIKSLDELQEVLYVKVLGLGNSYVGGQETKTTTHVVTQKASSRGEILAPCAWVRDLAKYELARGRARIRDITPGTPANSTSSGAKSPPAAKSGPAGPPGKSPAPAGKSPASAAKAAAGKG